MSLDPRGDTAPTAAERAHLTDPLDPAVRAFAAAATEPTAAEVAALLRRRAAPALRPSWVLPALFAGLAGVAWAAVAVWAPEPAEGESAPAVESAPSGAAPTGAAPAGAPAPASAAPAEEAPVGEAPGVGGGAEPGEDAGADPAARGVEAPGAPAAAGPEAGPTSGLPGGSAVGSAEAPGGAGAAEDASGPSPDAVAFAALLARREAGEASPALLTDTRAFLRRHPGSAFGPEAEVLALEVGAAVLPVVEARAALAAWLAGHPADPRRAELLYLWATLGGTPDCATALPALREAAATPGPQQAPAAGWVEVCGG